MATNVKSMALSYGLYASGLGLGTTVGKVAAANAEQVEKAGDIVSRMPDPATNAILKHFPEMVANGSMYILDGTLFIHGLSLTFISGFVVAIISGLGLIGRAYFDWTVTRTLRKIREAELKDLETLGEWAEK